MLNMPGGWEWIVILIVALLIFGRRLPEVARSVGKALMEFRRGMEEIKSDVETAVYKSEREHDEQKRLELPKTDTGSAEAKAPHESDDTEKFGDPYAPTEIAEVQREEERQQDTEAKSEEKEKERDSPAESSPPAQEGGSSQVPTNQTEDKKT